MPLQRAGERLPEPLSKDPVAQMIHWEAFLFVNQFNKRVRSLPKTAFRFSETIVVAAGAGKADALSELLSRNIITFSNVFVDAQLGRRLINEST